MAFSPTEYAISHARVTVFLVAAIALAGILTLRTMPSQEDP